MAPGIDQLYSTNSWQSVRRTLYTKYTMMFSLVSATTMAAGLFDSQNLHEGPGLLLDFSCLFGQKQNSTICLTKLSLASRDLTIS